MGFMEASTVQAAVVGLLVVGGWTHVPDSGLNPDVADYLKPEVAGFNA
jgi:hypothetical protein